jgi:hypothetical protein
MTKKLCGVVVVIFGLESLNFNCSCSYYSICGTQVKHDLLICFKKRLVETNKFFSVLVKNATINILTDILC